MSSRAEREAWNEARFRKQNEWIERTSEGFDRASPTETYVCECGDGECSEPIELTRAEYEGVRTEATHFVVAPDHENPEVEQLISECSRFTVVDKFEAAARRIARATDPRSGQPPADEP
jgi:hypothetical protein